MCKIIYTFSNTGGFMDWQFFIRKLLHDLVNPLAGSKMNLELLNMGASTPEEVIPEVEAQLDRIQFLIEQTRGLVSIPIEENVDPLTESEISQLQAELLEAFPGCEADVAWDTLPEILLPTDALKKILFALVQNAVDQQATKFSLLTSGDVYDCRDNGTPFSDRSVTEALTPFFSTREDAAGLGLNVIEYILDGYGGELILRPDDSTKRALLVLKFPR
jgi:nitrogen-specific signal transduction histidine kinase